MMVPEPTRRDDRPALTFCHKCQTVTFHAIIGNRDISGLLRCEGCHSVWDYERKDERGIPKRVV